MSTASVFFSSARMLRGGSWIDDGEDGRSARRGRFGPDNRRWVCGFRQAAVLDVGTEPGKEG